ncbi:MAG: hypothetical protein KDK39_04665 [Leptospiraceae bacterium]|nr:hypothetical protein [Leptospiraceae bacterium]
MAQPTNPVRRLLFQTGTSLLAMLASLVLALYHATLEIVVEGDDEIRLTRGQSSNFILAVWHTFVDAAAFGLHTHNLLIYSDHPRTKNYRRSIQNISREVGLKTLNNLGYEVLDASLGKQSQGIMNFIKAIRSGRPALVAPDGPSGPNYEAKPGVIYMARKSDSVVIPVGVGCNWRITGPNWDDFILPLPFARIALVYGKAITPSADTSEESLARQASEMERQLDELCFRARDLAEGKAAAGN